MTKAKVEAVNKILMEGEPENISIDEHSGYTGYKPQHIIDAMNEVFWGEWGFEELSSEVVAGDKGGLAIAQVKVRLKGIDFEPPAWGQNRVTRGDIGDARKGAQTDAIKKALSYFSIGNRAYRGLLPDGKTTKNQSQPRQLNAPQRQPQAQQTAQPNEPSNGATEAQMASIRNLCRLLKKPELEGITSTEQAKTILSQLAQEYRTSQQAKAS